MKWKETIEKQRITAGEIEEELETNTRPSETKNFIRLMFRYYLDALEYFTPDSSEVSMILLCTIIEAISYDRGDRFKSYSEWLMSNDTKELRDRLRASGNDDDFRKVLNNDIKCYNATCGARRNFKNTILNSIPDGEYLDAVYREVMKDFADRLDLLRNCCISFGVAT